MGLFDNIIGTGAIDEVDPLGMEHITDDNAPTPGTGGTGNGGATGTSSGTGPGMFGGFSGKKDDSKGDDGSVLIIHNDTTTTTQTENNNTPTILIHSEVPAIDTSSEIPDIDIGGDMNFGALIEDTPMPTIAENHINTTTPQINIIQESTQNPSPAISSISQEIVLNIPPSVNSPAIPTPTTITSDSPAIPVNSLFANINIPNATEVINTNTGVSASIPNGTASIPNINISLLDTEVSTELTSGIPAITLSENTSPTITGINLLDGLNSEAPVISGNNLIDTAPTEVPLGLNGLISDSITEASVTKDKETTTAPEIISIDTPPEQISETAVKIATDMQKTKESLAERISEFLKELEALKANDEALLKEKQAAIAKLEEAKKPIEEELKKIQDDEKRINDTIDLLSNIKNI